MTDTALTFFHRLKHWSVFGKHGNNKGGKAVGLSVHFFIGLALGMMSKAHWRSFLWLVLADYRLEKTYCTRFLGFIGHLDLFLAIFAMPVVCHCELQNTRIFRLRLFIWSSKRFIVSGWQGGLIWQRSWKSAAETIGYTRLFPCVCVSSADMAMGSLYKVDKDEAQMVW